MLAALRQQIRGDCHADQVRLGLHATDASHYQQWPRYVVIPRDEADCLAALRLAHEAHIPLTPRGAATSLSGQTFGPGMVLDLSEHMDQVLEVNPGERWVRVQPGVVRDRLNHQIHATGLHFAPDPATSNRATIGGMIGNNSSGTRSIVYGKTLDHVLELKLALPDGSVMTVGPEDAATWHRNSLGDEPAAQIHRGVQQIIEQNQNEILARYPDIPRRVSGYNLDEFVDGAGFTGKASVRPGDDPKAWNLAHLVVGSEGTLALVLEAKLRLTLLPKATAIAVLHFFDVLEALRTVPRINAHNPSAVELLDRVVLREARVNPATRELATFIEGDPAGMLVVEMFGQTLDEARQRVERLVDELKQHDIGYAHPIHTEPAEQQQVWDTRKLGLGLISNTFGSVKGQAFVEDACVPLEHLPEYIGKLMNLCEKLEVNYSLYAHASVGVIHFRPMLDLHRSEHRQIMQTIAEQAFDWSVEFGGVFAGEHGDGILRGQFVPRFFGPKLYEAFRQVKQLFDPHNLMNPGKIVDAPSMVDPSLLRYGNQYRIAEIPSAFAHRDQGGFRLAVEQCNGVGACRKVGSGVMCPSYMATRDEKDTTRGRANALRLAMSGQLGDDPVAALGSDGVYEVLELCLSCKACKQECPNAVDMSRLKSDALHFRHQTQGAPLVSWVIAQTPRLAKLASGPWAGLINAVQASGIARRMNAWVLGMDARRVLPGFASQTLSRQLKKRRKTSGDTPQPAHPGRQVVLFDDTYSNYFEPSPGVAAVRLLEGLGYDVQLAKAGCCQRPAISKGMLDIARERGAATMEALDVYARQGLPIVVLEPSCASALREDLPDLIDDQALGERVASQVQLLEVFLSNQLETGVIQPEQLHCDAERLLVHGHCHEKASVGMQPLMRLLQSLPGVEAKLIDAGCCGMAGSFGYEHFDVSKKVAEERLLPALREHDESWQVVAPGFSCRHQIADFADRKACHWVECVSAGDV